MSADPVERVADALLFEGYMLYPYRPTSAKNRHRFNFGVVGPPGSEGAGAMQTECLIQGDASTLVNVRVRFLHLVERRFEIAEPADDSLTSELLGITPRYADQPESWHEAVSRDVRVTAWTLGELCTRLRRTSIAFPATERTERIADANRGSLGVVMREQRALAGTITVSAQPRGEGVFSLRVTISNESPFTAEDGAPCGHALLSSLVSTHKIIEVAGGEFISLLDPPSSLRTLASQCRNVHTWPVLAGSKQRRNIVLSSPIILYDFPEVAPESPGDLFDATEIDEILSLRILTLTDDERKEMARADDQSRQLLERTESLTPDEFLRMHGVLHNPKRRLTS